ncbi:MAG TPA: alkaline phosphatase family protein [Candidatus Baltobacteraceae bacterium]
MPRVFLFLSIVATLALASCTGGSQPSLRLVPAPATNPASSPVVGNYIKHVIIIVQENRSFDNLFAGFPGADAPMFGYDLKHRRIPLQTVDFIPLVNLDHDFQPAVRAWNHGKMNGFNGTVSGLPNDYPYAHLRRSEILPYWDLAQHYVLADHMFPTEFGPSFTGHLSLIAGTTSLSPTKALADNPIGGPWGCDAAPGTITFTVNLARVIKTGPFPCFTQFHTMADVLDAGRLAWKYYAPAIDADKGGVLWSSFDTIHAVRYGADWSADMSSPQTNVLADAKNGKLPNVGWVIPDWTWSDHPSSGSDLGPSWVAAVVNAIGNGPEWKSTAIVIVWDDWGGWYDNVPPPKLHDFRGPGIRVGCIIISPYAKPHYVDHTQYEFGSILRFAEEAFGLPTIGPESAGYTDARARSLDNAFDFTQAPRPFTTIPAKYPPSTFLLQKPSGRPPDTDL